MKGIDHDHSLLQIVHVAEARKTHYINEDERKELKQLESSVQDGAVKASLGQLLKDLDVKKRQGQRPNAKVSVLRELQRALEKGETNPRSNPKSPLKIRPDKTDAKGKFMPRLDFYKAKSWEDLAPKLESLKPVVVDLGESNLSNGTIVIGAGEKDEITEEMLDAAAECSDCLVISLCLATKNKDVIHTKRGRFRYIQVFGASEHDTASIEVVVNAVKK
jgi:hypothetical protein